VEYQLESAIETVLDHHMKAKQLAKECLYKAKHFGMWYLFIALLRTTQHLR
jgi:hypothetical protein